MDAPSAAEAGEEIAAIAAAPAPLAAEYGTLFSACVCMMDGGAAGLPLRRLLPAADCWLLLLHLLAGKMVRQAQHPSSASFACMKCVVA